LAVERIKITPTEIVTKNNAGNITFSTNNKYVKTQTGGQFSTSGYNRAPTIYGWDYFMGNNHYITEHPDEGAFCCQGAALDDADTIAYVRIPTESPINTVYIPSFDNIYFRWVRRYGYSTLGPAPESGYSPTLNYLFNGAPSTGTYQLFAWKDAINAGKGSYLLTLYAVANFSPTAEEKRTGGAFTFDRSQWTGVVNNSYYTDMLWGFDGVWASKNPVTFGLAVTS